MTVTHPVTNGVVAAGHAATAAAAAETLHAGGNAYDAAVAAGFAACVAEPCLSSLGGGGFLLARTAGGREVLFDFFVDTPGRGRPSDAGAPELIPATVRFAAAQQVFYAGHASIAVPGCLAGYLHVHRHLGRLPLAEVIEPARRMARDGVVLGPDQAFVVRILEPIFSITPAARAMFVPAEGPFGDDETVANPALARFLAAVADGTVTGFDHPDVAGPIIRDMADHGGWLTETDLRGYTVVEREPLRVEHRHARVLTNPAPSFGGTLITHALAALAQEGPAGPFGSGVRLRQLVDALEEMTLRHVAPSSARGTTHVSVADGEGNLASMTTSNGSGSGVMLGDTGVLANNIMGETDLHPAGFHLAPPGQRVGSMMAPTILLRADAAPVVLGSGGSERIRSALTQTIGNLLDHGMSLQDAVLAPRLHWDGTTVQLEPGFSSQAVAKLAEQRPVNVWEVGDLYFGGVHAVVAGGDGIGDPRRGGCTVRVEA